MAAAEATSGARPRPGACERCAMNSHCDGTGAIDGHRSSRRNDLRPSPGASSTMMNSARSDGTWQFKFVGAARDECVRRKAMPSPADRSAARRPLNEGSVLGRHFPVRSHRAHPPGAARWVRDRIFRRAAPRPCGDGWHCLSVFLSFFLASRPLLTALASLELGHAERVRQGGMSASASTSCAGGQPIRPVLLVQNRGSASTNSEQPATVSILSVFDADDLMPGLGFPEPIAGFSQISDPAKPVRSSAVNRAKMRVRRFSKMSEMLVRRNLHRAAGSLRAPDLRVRMVGRRGGEST